MTLHWIVIEREKKLPGESGIGAYATLPYIAKKQENREC
jgi:hypothetical protein